MTTSPNPDLRTGEAGFILPLVLIIVAIGAMVVIGLLGYTSGLLRAGGEDTDALRELYAADAGVTHVKKLLEQSSLLTVIEPIEVNGLEVKMAVTPVGTPGTAVPTPQPYPIDPELPEELDAPHRVTLNSLPEGTKVDVFWVFTPPTPAPTPVPTPTPGPPDPNATPTPTPIYPSITVYEGEGTATPVATSVPLPVIREGENPVALPEEELGSAATYFVDFDPGSLIGLESAAFTDNPEDCQNELEPHFCLTTPLMDYIVVATAGQTTVTAYLRQIPKWTPGIQGEVSYTHSGGEVYTLSWKPYPPDE